MVAISARLIAIANALEGTHRASAARVAGMDRQTLKQNPGCAIGQRLDAGRS
jgi:hypothetical protein